MVAAFAEAVAPFKQRSENIVREVRPVDDVLVHVRALLVADTDPARAVARQLLPAQDALPESGQTVLLRPHLAELLGLLHERLKPVLSQGTERDRAELARLSGNYSNSLSDLGRRSESLSVAREVEALYRALARQNPDAFQPALARSLGVLGRTLEGNERREEALASFAESVRVLTPHLQALPAAHAPLMELLAQEYQRLAQALRQPPDETLLAPVREVLRPTTGTG
jgi:hypothetical protein